MPRRLAVRSKVEDRKASPLPDPSAGSCPGCAAFDSRTLWRVE